MCRSWQSPIKFHCIYGKLAEIVHCPWKSQKIPLSPWRDSLNLSQRWWKFWENLSKSTVKFPEIVSKVLEIPRHCPQPLKNGQRISLSLLRNSQTLFPTPGKFPQNSPEATDKFPEIVCYSWKFPMNSTEPTEKFPEILHYIWKIAREFLWVYMDISGNCLHDVGNSQRISLSLLRNSEIVHYSSEISRNCPIATGNSQRIPMGILRNSNKLSMIPGKFQFPWGYWDIPNPGKFPKIVHYSWEFLREFFWDYWESCRNCPQPLGYSQKWNSLWGYWEICIHCSQPLENCQRIPLSLPWNPQKLSTSPAKFPENFSDTTEKFPEIVHLGSFKRILQAYHEIPTNCPWPLANSKRIPLRVLRNSQKFNTTSGKFPENSPWGYQEIPRNCSLALENSQRIPLSLLRNSNGFHISIPRNSQKFSTSPGKFI